MPWAVFWHGHDATNKKRVVEVVDKIILTI